MAQPYVGEIRIFAGNFPPSGWLFCEGQLLPISENETLFQLIGTTYGGDGEETFALPDLQGRTPVHQGNGFVMAQTAGEETVTLTVNQIPVHTHAFTASADQTTTPNPGGNVIGAPLTATPLFATPPDTALAAQTITPVGGSQPHENMQPYLCVNFIISLFGIFPSPT
ncbi:MAG TPA: tail fiber protein [Allosphingosinicella sp.]|jgi:microcystin-dependent protein